MLTFPTCSQWLNCGGTREVRSDISLKAHFFSHFSPCYDHTSPTRTDDGTSQIDRYIGAYVPYSLRTMSRVRLRPLPTEVQGWRRQGQRLNATAQWRDHLNWERGFTASMISPVFLKTLVDSPAEVWTHDLPLSRPALFQRGLPGGGWRKPSHGTLYTQLL